MLNQMEIDALEDVRVMIQARCLGPAGLRAAKAYANDLMHRAMTHYANGDLRAAIALAVRDFEFNSKMFGLQHPFTRSARKCLAALRRRERTAEAEGEIAFAALKTLTA